MYYMNNYGVKNEINFVEKLNNKKFIEVNYLLQLFLEDLYNMKIDNNEIIHCYHNKKIEKTDIYISINGIIKYISIKSGSKNSVHTIGISSFIHFLIENNIPKEIVVEYLKYHYADGTTNGKGKIRLSSAQYKEENMDKINKINEYFNKENILKNVIEKFVIGKNNSFKGIDAIIYGTPEDFLYIKSSDITRILLSNLKYSTGVHFGNLFSQPEDRCLNYNPKYEGRRFCVQIKWYSLFDDIILSMCS